MNDPIPSAITELIAFFTSELAEVKFPEVDAVVLGELAAEARAAADAVARAELALVAMKATLAETLDVVLARAHRAHAYASVFAEANPVLAARLLAISLPRSRRTAIAKGVPGGGEERPSARRGRPPKARPAVGSPSEDGLAAE